MSATTRHVLDTRLHELVVLLDDAGHLTEKGDLTPAGARRLEELVFDYEQDLTTASKLALVRHLLGVMWDVLRGPSGWRPGRDLAKVVRGG